MTTELAKLRQELAHLQAETSAEKAARESLSRGKHEVEQQFVATKSQVIALTQQVPHRSLAIMCASHIPSF